MPACSGTATAWRLPGWPTPKTPSSSAARRVDRFRLAPGEHFVIGQTTFTLADQQVNVSADAPVPLQQQSFSSQYLKQVQFRNPDHRIEVLSRLPDVISGATGDQELFVRLVSMLLAGVPRADAAAVVAVESEEEGEEQAELRGQQEEKEHNKATPGEATSGSSPSEVRSSSSASRPTARVLHWDQRLAITTDFRPSQGLILESVRQRQSMLARLARRRRGHSGIVHRQRHLRLGLLHARARASRAAAGGSTWPGGSTSSGPA